MVSTKQASLLFEAMRTCSFEVMEKKGPDCILGTNNTLAGSDKLLRAFMDYARALQSLCNLVP